MDTLFLTLMAFTVMTTILGLAALAEWVMLSVLRSKWWREMPPGQLKFDFVTLLGIVVPGAFTGLILFCIHAVLGWTGISAAIALFALNIWIMRWLQRNEPESTPMAIRRVEQ